MTRLAWILPLTAALGAPCALWGGAPERPAIRVLTPPEQGFYAKRLDYHGIPIKAAAVVSDEALHEAYGRLDLELKHLPVVVSNLAAAGAELHIIGRDQVTTDLPEWQMDKHVPLDEYEGLTRDQRTRGMGGLITSCGEENLLKLPRSQDRYFGRDICLHEFAHDIHGCGLDEPMRERIRQQAAKSKAKGLWIDSYAGSNEFEFFAELTMWYFGTHGDLTMKGPRPGNGPEGLKAYDPEGYALLDDLYQGRISIAKSTYQPTPDEQPDWVPQDSQVARSLVKTLGAYRVGSTKLAAFQADAGLADAKATGKNGWRVTRIDTANPSEQAFRAFFRDPKGRDHNLADLSFKAGLLSSFRWNN